jgi:hypothetical protein
MPRERPPRDDYDFAAGGLTGGLEFLKQVNWQLRTLRKVRIWTDRFQVFDVNGDYLEIRGIGYAEPEILPLMNAVCTVYDPQTIHEPTAADYKELLTGRRHPWAEDRVM